MKYGFVKAAVASPRVKVADPAANADELISLAEQAAKAGVCLLVFPELSLTGATCGDLFLSEALLNATERALDRFLRKTATIDTVICIGLPLRRQNRLYSCSAVCQKGKLLGVVPKTVLQNFGESNAARWFTSAPCNAPDATVRLLGEEIPFGSQLLFACRELPELTLALELGEDAAALLPPSALHAAAGANVIALPAASHELVNSTENRRRQLSAQSAKEAVAYLYACAGVGESTTDLVFGGHDLIYENGRLLAERAPFDAATPLLCSELDVALLARESRRRHLELPFALPRYRRIEFSLTVADTALSRFVDPHPFIPADPAALAARCETILTLQAEGLKTRIERAYAKKLVLGISGGLDSTLALLVCARALDLLGRPRTDILAVTMPGFGTTGRTKNNATVLCEQLGVDFRCVNISRSVEQHFADIGHDPADRNVAYENAQARERTQVLMDIANDHGGMVIGTGDLSELALGWATYNGDHMSMYSVNGAVPKTLIRHIVGYAATVAEHDGAPKLAAALLDILDTPVSPELLPADEHGNIAQKTEDLVGPYELHDFYLYYMLRYGFPPAKLLHLAKYALGGSYSDEVLKKWLTTLLRRFFSQQFKRSCLPDGPKLGSVGFSPRGDWQMPSDASASAWLEELE